MDLILHIYYTFHNIVIVNLIKKNQMHRSTRFFFYLPVYIFYTQIGFRIDIFAVYQHREVAMVAC